MSTIDRFSALNFQGRNVGADLQTRESNQPKPEFDLKGNIVIRDTVPNVLTNLGGQMASAKSNRQGFAAASVVTLAAGVLLGMLLTSHPLGWLVLGVCAAAAGVFAGLAYYQGNKAETAHVEQIELATMFINVVTGHFSRQDQSQAILDRNGKGEGSSPYYGESNGHLSFRNGQNTAGLRQPSAPLQSGYSFSNQSQVTEVTNATREGTGSASGGNSNNDYFSRL